MKARWLLLLLPLFAIVVWAKSSRPATPAASVATLAAAAEPGTRLIVTGRVWDHTGAHGVPGVKLYAYHTDAKGVYGPVPNHPRLEGHVVTDSEGRFEWRTIRPMPYPGGGNPAHIHIEASEGGYPKQWVDELQFIDDPYLTDAQKKASRAKGRFGSIVSTRKDEKGALHATFNIRMSKNPRR
jgi:protocatechuate 3,4-dioxygenase, beta subunit